MEDLLYTSLSLFPSIENQITVILPPSICQNTSLLLLSGHTSEKGLKGLVRGKFTTSLLV